MTFPRKPVRWNERKLAASERPTAVYEYYVTGRRYFPHDMLRYDAAWPASGDDAATIEFDPFGSREERTVRLLSHRPPTVDRWTTFGWSVGATRPWHSDVHVLRHTEDQ